MVKDAVLEVPTVEGLAAKMKVPADALKRTLARYNGLVKGGRDLDFGKRADRLTAVDAPPFYAQWNPNPDRPMLIFGGLLTGERLQAVDAAGRPRRAIQGVSHGSEPDRPARRPLAFVEKAIKEKGRALRYSTPGVTLLRECQGRTTAVIATAPDSSYVRLDGRTGSAARRAATPPLMEFLADLL
ncbi:MAG: hypothetical protein KA072_15130 [Thermoanaerobaculaceae bacterium]|nr:hypothetical protein [Thermoanaerobaculaceae bacterium]NLH12137.1 hypothetical protein [Holophagae bacterium]